MVVGGDNGWEVSFDGNVNAFYTVGDYDKGYVTEAADKTSSRVHSGFLPAFFSFNVKSPTIDGMTGSARISFAPTIQTGGTKTQFSSQSGNVGPVPGIGGATIDTREVVANLSGEAEGGLALAKDQPKVASVEVPPNAVRSIFARFVAKAEGRGVAHVGLRAAGSDGDRATQETTIEPAGASTMARPLEAPPNGLLRQASRKIRLSRVLLSSMISRT